MPLYRVKILRYRRITEVGYRAIVADTREDAEAKVAEMDDPDEMAETRSDLTGWECHAEPDEAP